jgi:hypothetical protein
MLVDGPQLMVALVGRTTTGPPRGLLARREPPFSPTAQVVLWLAESRESQNRYPFSEERSRVRLSPCCSSPRRAAMCLAIRDIGSDLWVAVETRTEATGNRERGCGLSGLAQSDRQCVRGASTWRLSYATTPVSVSLGQTRSGGGFRQCRAG